jgi:hypothetical protein
MNRNLAMFFMPPRENVIAKIYDALMSSRLFYVVRDVSFESSTETYVKQAGQTDRREQDKKQAATDGGGIGWSGREYLHESYESV